MGKRGPTKKPTKLEKLQGRPGRRPLPKKEPQPTAGAPRCPAWLDASAKAEWKALAPELERIGLVTLIDGGALASYCQAWSLFERTTKAINKAKSLYYRTESGVRRPIPEVALQLEAMRTMRAFAAEFGLTPAARARLQVEPPQEASEAEVYLFEESRGKEAG